MRTFEDILLHGISLKELNDIVKIYKKRLKDYSYSQVSISDIVMEYFGINEDEFKVIWE
jgi:hypothetical protein